MVQTWASTPAEQKDFIQTLDQKLATLDQRLNPTTYYNESAAPTADNLNQGLYAKTQWVKPSSNKLRNTYLQIEDGAVAGTTTFTSYPLIPVPSVGVLTPLAAVSNGASAGLATLSLAVPSQSYTDLYVYVYLRSTAAAASANMLVRVNAGATAVYSFNWQGANTNFGLANEQNSLTGWTFTAPANTSDSFRYLHGWLYLPSYNETTRPKKMLAKINSQWGAPSVAASRANYNGGGFYNLAGAITSVDFVTTTGTAAGTRLILYGI